MKKKKGYSLFWGIVKLAAIGLGLFMLVHTNRHLDEKYSLPQVETGSTK